MIVVSAFSCVRQFVGAWGLLAIFFTLMHNWVTFHLIPNTNVGGRNKWVAGSVFRLLSKVWLSFMVIGNFRDWSWDYSPLVTWILFFLLWSWKLVPDLFNRVRWTCLTVSVAPKAGANDVGRLVRRISIWRREPQCMSRNPDLFQKSCKLLLPVCLLWWHWVCDDHGCRS